MVGEVSGGMDVFAVVGEGGDGGGRRTVKERESEAIW